METITWNDFAKIELRVGRIVEARVFAEARKPAYVLQVDFGAEIGIRKSSAQITKLYSPEELVGKLVMGVVNFPKKQIGPVMSECLVTGFYDANGDVALCVPDKPVPLGAKLGDSSLSLSVMICVWRVARFSVATWNLPLLRVM